MGTTTDKLNRLIETKEGIRQEINRIYGAEEVSTSDTFNSYIQKLEGNPFYLLEYIERTMKNAKVSDVTTVGDYAFFAFPNLSSVSFPNATAIGVSAFRNCTSLSSVDFPNVSSMGDDAFARCSNLSSVSFPMVTSVGDSAFLDCSNLSSVSFPNAKYIFNGAFRSCTSLSSVSFPNVTRIFDDAFRACGGLTTASFPKLTRIDPGKNSWIQKSGAFYNCVNLTTLYIGTKNSGVCELGDGALQGCSNLTNIYVPASLVDIYKSDSSWHSYASKIKAAP